VEESFKICEKKLALLVTNLYKGIRNAVLPPDNMPPKIDPYATARAKTFDLFLCVLAVVLMLVAFRSAPRNHSPDMPTRSPAAATLATK